jgi:hypothetical protein
VPGVRDRRVHLRRAASSVPRSSPSMALPCCHSSARWPTPKMFSRRRGTPAVKVLSRHRRYRAGINPSPSPSTTEQRRTRHVHDRADGARHFGVYHCRGEPGGRPWQRHITRAARSRLACRRRDHGKPFRDQPSQRNPDDGLRHGCRGRLRRAEKVVSSTPTPNSAHWPRNCDWMFESWTIALSRPLVRAWTACCLRLTNVRQRTRSTLAP